ncbi:2'-5' RNA ligase family protein [Pseudoxanthomonas sp. 10H]|uniref:2'-5' RNA ligase family protein n=1 Tax=Pseudoxanthomonas sp. 10H TaxID=3242729 RepID=UPI00355817C7
MKRFAPDEAFWHRRCGWDRLIFIGRSSAHARDDLEHSLVVHGIREKLGRQAFARHLRHQSLSDRYMDKPEIRERLLHVGASMQFPAFTVELDALVAEGLHVEARSRKPCAELARFIILLNEQIDRYGLPPGGGHRPHITLAYSFTGSLPRTQSMPRVDWPIDELELVVGRGTPYDYTTLGSWKLGPARPQQAQDSLF